MRPIYALALGLGLAGCATGPSLDTRLASYIGAPEATLVAQFGVPQRQIKVGDITYLAYTLRYDAQSIPMGPVWGGWGWGPGWGGYGGLPADVQIYSCEATFALQGGKVENYTLRGNDCR